MRENRNGRQPEKCKGNEQTTEQQCFNYVTKMAVKKIPRRKKRSGLRTCCSKVTSKGYCSPD